jgi:Tat protein translocase TatB subunit
VGSIGAPEILVILVVALLVLGPNRLPEAARQVGRAMAELRRMSAGFQAELRGALDSASSTDAGPARAPGAPQGPSAGVDAAPPPTNGSAQTPTFVWGDLPDSPGSPR